MTEARSAADAPDSFKEVWLCSAGHAMEHWYLATFYILLPLIGRELGLSYTEIGLIMTTQHIVGAISNLPGGMVVDMVGKKGYLMATSLFWVGFPYALMSLTHSYWMLLAAASAVGLGSSIFHPESSRIARMASGGQHGLAQSVFQVGGNFGTSVGPLLAAFFVVPHGQGSVAWLALLALFSVAVLSYAAKW